VALRGENHDAHDYLAQARTPARRAQWWSARAGRRAGGPALLRGADTLAALGRSAAARRRQLGARVCAVAGSNGKTTTKDCCARRCRRSTACMRRRGNFNNLIGAPLTLLAAPDDAEVIVAEIGTNTPGEIAQLAAIVEPDAAVITGISAEHLEGLGDLHGVLREETSVLPWVPRTAPSSCPTIRPCWRSAPAHMHPVRVAGLTEHRR
jgi:UDP-N-acetylmuramoyl-tripeptide--D-alanyl-D-alanine ligase